MNMWTNSQLSAALNNGRKDAVHKDRMQNDPEYAAAIKLREEEYEWFCKIHGEMER